MKRLIGMLILISLSMTVCIAQDKKEDIKTLFQLMQSDKMIDKTMEGISSVMSQQFLGQFSEDKEILKKMTDFMETETKAAAKKMRVNMMAVYEKHFTHQDIKEYIKFYQSPAGKKMLKKQPEIQKDMLEYNMEYLPDLQEKISKIIEEL